MHGPSHWNYTGAPCNIEHYIEYYIHFGPKKPLNRQKENSETNNKFKNRYTSIKSQYNRIKYQFKNIAGSFLKGLKPILN